MVFSNMIVDVTISCRSFGFSQSRAKVSAGFRQTGSSIQEQMLRLPCHLHWWNQYHRKFTEILNKGAQYNLPQLFYWRPWILALEMKPATFRTSGQRSTNWTIPAAMNHEILNVCFALEFICTHLPAAKAKDTPAIKHTKVNKVFAMAVGNNFPERRKRSTTKTVSRTLSWRHLGALLFGIICFITCLLQWCSQ